jgi:threonine synthase
MSTKCIECGRKLTKEEKKIGYCTECNLKVENDLSILRESEDDNFCFVKEI